MNYILDASATACLVLPDESSLRIEKIIESKADTSTLYVPILWWSETSNILTQAIKTKRIKLEDINVILNIFSKLNMMTDIEHNSKYQTEIIHLSLKHNLSSYDATYLELALRKGGKLLTLDKKLFKVADKLYNFP